MSKLSVLIFGFVLCLFCCCPGITCPAYLTENPEKAISENDQNIDRLLQSLLFGSEISRELRSISDPDMDLGNIFHKCYYDLEKDHFYQSMSEFSRHDVCV